MFRSLAALILLASPAAACTCESNPPIEKAYAEAQYVFAGRVDHAIESPIVQGMREVKVSIQEWYKGKDALDRGKENFVVVYTPLDEGSCGINFYAEQDYVVFAKGVPARLKSDICSGTLLLDNALPQMKKLKQLAGF